MPQGIEIPIFEKYYGKGDPSNMYQQVQPYVVI
jgi:hypothetical protein